MPPPLRVPSSVISGQELALSKEEKQGQRQRDADYQIAEHIELEIPQPASPPLGEDEQPQHYRRHDDIHAEKD